MAYVLQVNKRLNPMNSPEKGNYIAGIDGLRAISVLAVIAFHYASGIESAGYLGVDAFFVISGFVITASLANYKNPSSLKDFAVQFYLKRFRRLLPALVTVVAFTTLLVMLVTTQGRDHVRTGALSLIGGANIFLYIKEADYFALTSELNPFTHMWSLAVEDQFYLLFPFLIWWSAYFSAIKNNGNFLRLIKAMAIICALSLAGFVMAFRVDYSFAFYMMPTRLWQIGTGIVVYILVSRTQKLSFLTHMPLILPIVLLFATLAFGHIAPLAAHISVTIITAACLGILWFNQGGKSLLSTSVPVYIGKISYSLYLWHWPLIVLAKHTIGTSPLNVCLCLALTFIFAIASYHLIEQPLRHYKRQAMPELRSRQFKNIFNSILASTLVLYVGLSRYAPKETNALSLALGVPEVPELSRHRCHGIPALRKYENPLKACLGEPRTSDKPNKVYLLGDSHANQFSRIIASTLEPTSYQLQFINAESHRQGVSGLISRENFIPDDFAYMLEDAQPDDVLILTFHRGRLNEKMDVHINPDTPIRPNTLSRNFVNNLRPVLDQLKQKDVKVMLIHDTPLMASVTTSQSCVIQQKLSGDNLCKVTRKQDNHTRTRQTMAYKELAQEFSNIRFWDPLNTIYGSVQTHDVLDEEGNYLMYDWSHITEKLASRLQPEFEEIFTQITNKVD